MSKILVVEDDADSRLGLCIRLKSAGYETCMAGDGLGATMAATKERPDLILLDLGLPAGDGLAVLERLKKNNATAAIPVIVVSARDPAVHKPIEPSAEIQRQFRIDRRWVLIERPTVITGGELTLDMLEGGYGKGHGIEIHDVADPANPRCIARLKSPPSFVGKTLHHAYLTVDLLGSGLMTHASNATPLLLTP